MRLRSTFLPLLLAGVTLITLSACAPEPPARHTPLFVSQTPDPARAIVLPTSLPLPAQAAPTATSPAGPIEAANDDAAPQPAVRYRLEAELSWPDYVVQVDEWVDLRNETGEPLRELVFTVEFNGDANGSATSFSLKRIATGANLVIENYTLEGAELKVTLPQPLPPEGLLTLQIAYELAVPPIADGYQLGHLGYLGYSARQVNLGSWFPLLAYYDPASGWLSPQQHTVGEQAARRLASFDVTLRVTDGPEGLLVAAPGATSLDEGVWRFVLDEAREVALSLSAQYEKLSVTTESGVEAEVYYFAEPGRAPDAPRHALQTAAEALTLFERLYDQPYAHRRLTVVEGDFPDGMEFSGLVFVSRDWFRAWQGVPNDWLTLITAHEVAHQWWYSVIGSDQGNYPYLDEALAIYSELLYFERYYPEHVAWWWHFRVGAYGPTGFVDATVYDFHSPRVYINAVYLQGAKMMQALRDDLGDLAFFGWLQRYAGQMHGQLATPADFWGALTGEQYAATLETRQQYLRNAHVLARSSDLP